MLHLKYKQNQSWVFQKTNKTDDTLARLIKKKREKAQISNARNEKGNISTDAIVLKNIMKEYYV